jgi:PhnB protein
MEKLNPYLTFSGNCEEAFYFYKSIFGGEFSHISRYRDIPSDEGLEIPEYRMNKIKHIVLPLGKKCQLIGSDCDDGWCPRVEKGNNVSLAIEVESKQKADDYFEALCADGTITMQIGDVFWGSYYGMCTDKFGVTWIIDHPKPEGNT